jgi:hypothetical protein
MATKDAPLTLTEVIDHVERIREELLTVQRALEKIEPCPDRQAFHRTRKALGYSHS